jgi:hypothetical protein
MDREKRLPHSPPSTINETSEAASAERQSAERRLVRKLDMRLIPGIFIIYIMNYINVSLHPPLS